MEADGRGQNGCMPQAVEQYLDVRSFPTYKLFDTEGNFLNVNADSRNLDALENLVKRLFGKQAKKPESVKFEPKNCRIM